MADPVQVLVVGLGNMGRSHALAYRANPGFAVAGLMSRNILGQQLPPELDGLPRFEDFEEAMRETRPDAVSINSWPDSHAEYATRSLEAGCHVFMEKPIATTVAEAERIVALAKARQRRLVVGYILRVHPSWEKFVELARGLGKPLVMRMNLNQQSSGPAWEVHKALMQSVSPIVDCGVHYVDVMCQMTGARPVRVHGIGAHLTPEAGTYNYGALHVTFEDGSVGWYEAGWGPMMSETAFFVKDVIGPKGCVSMVAPPTAEAAGDAVSTSADMDTHTKTNALLRHSADTDAAGRFARKDEWISMADEPGHQELCDREQALFLRAIREDLDLGESMQDAVNSLRIVLAADESIRTGRAVEL